MSLRKKLAILFIAVASAVVLLLALAPGEQAHSPVAKAMTEDSSAWSNPVASSDWFGTGIAS